MSTSSIATVSERKLLANRKNAQKSTGPKTDAGKRKSSLNAQTHGLRSRLSTDALVCDHEREDFQLLADALHEELNPQTPLQHLLAERLALLAWKMRRTAAAEAALLDQTVARRRDYEQKENDRVARRNPGAPLPNTLTTAAHVQAEHAAHHPRQNAWLTLHRYDQATQREFHKTLKQYHSLQRQHDDQDDHLDEDALLDIYNTDGPNEPTEDADHPQPEPLPPPLASSRDPEEQPPSTPGPNEPTEPPDYSSV